MRIVAEIPHPVIKITVFSWNAKYLIKLERGPFEQTFKVDELDVSGEEEVKQLLDEAFLAEAMQRFDDMRASFKGTRERH